MNLLKKIISRLSTSNADIIYVSLIIIVLLSSISIVILNNRYHKTVEEINKSDIVDFYNCVARIENRMFTVMDTQVRILHYSIPHKNNIVGCPDCFKAMLDASKRMNDEEIK